MKMVFGTIVLWLFCSFTLWVSIGKGIEDCGGIAKCAGSFVKDFKEAAE